MSRLQRRKTLYIPDLTCQRILLHSDLEQAERKLKPAPEYVYNMDFLIGTGWPAITQAVAVMVPAATSNFIHSPAPTPVVRHVRVRCEF